MKFKVHTSTRVEELEEATYDTNAFYYTHRYFDGVSISEGNNADIEGDFSLEQLKLNDDNVFIPYFGYSKAEDNGFDGFNKNGLVQYLGVFLTEQKAKDAKQIIDLIYELDVMISKHGTKCKETKELSEKIKSEVSVLGGGWRQEGSEIKDITFLDENYQPVTIEKFYDVKDGIAESQIYATKVSMVELKKVKQKNIKNKM